MRVVLFQLCLILIGFSAILRTANFVAMYAFKTSLFGVLLGSYASIGVWIGFFGQPFPIVFAGNAFHYFAAVASALVAALALRRIVLLVRARSLVPSTFRGTSYVLASIALGLILIAAALHFAGMGVLVPSMVLSGAHLCLVFAFLICEVRSFRASKVEERPNSTAESDAREGGARGSP